LKFRKYYKSLFLGLVDMALVNAFIVYNAKRVSEGKPRLSHVQFMIELHAQLVNLHDGDLEMLDTPVEAAFENLSSVSQRHLITQSRDKRQGNTDGSQKLRQRTCKVCSLLREGTQRAAETTWCCSACHDHKGSAVYLCRQVRRAYNGANLSCFEIWHSCWRNGKALPKRKKRIRARRPTALDEEREGSQDDEGPHQPKRTRRSHAE
jgi:hypothetical protein